MTTASAIVDKHGRLSQLSPSNQSAIELGSGNNKKNAHAIGIDALDFPDVDVVGDVFGVLGSIPSGSISSVYTYHFIEHISDLKRLVGEVELVCSKGATVEFVAPHFSNPYFYSDPTHAKFFGLYTMSYFVKTTPFTRSVSTYGSNFSFALEGVDLIFKSASCFPFRYLLRRSLGFIVNLPTYTKEFYEENLAFCSRAMRCATVCAATNLQ
jgi:hypothetical protein